MKLIIFTLLLTLLLARKYPLFSQCDSQWANDRVGTSDRTICQIGCLMTSAAMALAGTGKSYNPKTLNVWLTNNGGYANKNLFVWASINKLGLTFKGFFANSQIKSNLDAGNVVIVNVRNGGHWVLAYGYNGNDILVNDPGYSTSSYPLSSIVENNNGVYTVNKMPARLTGWYYGVSDWMHEKFGWKRDRRTSPEPEMEGQMIRQE